MSGESMIFNSSIIYVSKYISDPQVCVCSLRRFLCCSELMISVVKSHLEDTVSFPWPLFHPLLQWSLSLGRRRRGGGVPFEAEQSMDTDFALTATHYTKNLLC